MIDSNGQRAAESGGLFDEHGRRIRPDQLRAPAHRRTRRYFDFATPKQDYRLIHERLSKHLAPDSGLTSAAFVQRAEGIRARLRDDPSTRNVTAGVGVPFILPRAVYADYGEALESTYLPGVARSFADTFPEYRFVRHDVADLAGKLTVVPGSRHERLLDAMRDEPQVGYLFPCLTAYSIPAAVEQMRSLPECFTLAGGFEISAALIGTPDLLMRTDGYPPLLWLSALQGERAGLAYHFEAYGYNLTWNRRPHLDRAAEYWASAVVVLG